jgi:putative glutamine amidotransferase
VHRIAISRCRKLPDYEASVRVVGGEPWVVDHSTQEPADVVRDAAGLLLTGGRDVDPSFYGEAAHHAFSAAEPGRDAYEIALVRCAFQAQVPILAICRGIQVLNVALGGTLVQDIPTELPSAIDHKLEVPPHAATTWAHEVRLEPDSRLETLIGRAGHSVRLVNSRHHQAVKGLGRGLRIVATAPDGVVEAIEAPDHRFCVAVQWHPEHFHRSGEFSGLFEGLAQACERR